MASVLVRGMAAEAIQREAVRRLAQRRLDAKQAIAPQTPQLLAAQQFRRDYPLRQFVEEGWDLVEPQPFVAGWHIDAYCLHLEAVTETAAATDDTPSPLPEIRNLLTNVPPRMSKSLVFSVFWNAWVWLSWPACRFLYSSYSKDLALRDATYCRNLMQTDWYASRKHVAWTFTSDQRVKSFYSNSAKGYRVTTSVGGMSTGWGGDIRCLPGDQRILTEDGLKTIGEIVEKRLDVRIASYNHTYQQIQWQEISAYHHTQYRAMGTFGHPLYTFHTDVGHRLQVTETHPLYLCRQARYSPAALVQEGDILRTYVDDTLAECSVTNIAVTHPPSDVYNLSIFCNNNYFAEGILVHNCGDDIHNIDEDYSVSRAEIAAAVQHWTQTMASRVTNAKRACRVLVGQRVALDDASNAVLEQGEYDYLKIPMEYEPSKVAPPTALGWVDPRTKEGELLCPARFTAKELNPLKATLSHRYFTQFQQDPRSELSSLFPKSKWQFFLEYPSIDWFDVLIQSWDARFGDAKDSGSYVAGHLWGRKGPPATGQVYLLDRFFERVGFVSTCKAIVSMSRKWPGAYVKLIEQAANGQAIFDTLRSQVYGLRLVPVGGKYSSKLARAEAEAFVLDQERAWVPHETIAPWVGPYMTNMERFPSEPDDDTDATSQAWHHLCPPLPAKDTVLEELTSRQSLERQIHLAQLRKGRRVVTSATRA